MQEDKKVLWRVRIIVCVLLVAAGLTLRFAVGGASYQVSKAWYEQQMQNSILPNSSLEGLQKSCKDFLSSGAAIVIPKIGGNTSSKRASQTASSASGTSKSSAALVASGKS